MMTGGPAPACSILPASPGPVRRHRGPDASLEALPSGRHTYSYCPRPGPVTKAEETEPCSGSYLSRGLTGMMGEVAGEY